MVLNFTIVKFLPKNPYLFCLKKIGFPNFIRINTQIIKIRGDKRIKSKKAKTLSDMNLNNKYNFMGKFDFLS